MSTAHLTVCASHCKSHVFAHNGTRVSLKEWKQRAARKSAAPSAGRAVPAKRTCRR